jgi:hypothetical protein
MRDAFKFLSGSVVVYLVMAACASERDRSEDGDSAGEGSSNGGAFMVGGGPNGGDGPTLGGATTAGAMTAGGRGGTSGPSDSGLMDRMIDPVPDAAADPVNGSRLKARYYVGADGSREPVASYGWYDSERRENCGFSKAPDGAIRCVPMIGAYAYGTYYRDGECMVELAVAGATCGAEAPRYANVAASSACTTYRIHQLGAAFTGTALFIKSGTMCVMTIATTGISYFEIGAEVPPTAFVQATEEVAP